MDRRELNKMFDGLAPAPGREKELLEKLLQDDVRRTRPMKNWRRIVVAVAAAALLVTAATAAVTSPQFSGALGKLLEVEPEDARSAELLAPGAMAVDITTESNGAALHITQVLRTKMDIVVVGEFSTAEGTVLDTGDFGESCWRPNAFRAGVGLPTFLNADGEVVELNLTGSHHAFWWSMPDEDPLDNRCLVYYVYGGYSEDMAEDMASMRVVARDFGYYVGGEHENYTTISGDWSFEVPLPQHDIGYVCRTDEAVTLQDGTDASLYKVYLSPMALEVTYRWRYAPKYMECPVRAILTSKNGDSVALDLRGYGSRLDDDGLWSSQFLIADYITQGKHGDYIDPADFQGGVLTLEWRLQDGKINSATFSLEGLEPVSP